MDLEQQLRAALAPSKPGPALRANVIARLSAGAGPARKPRRAPGRLVLGGTVLAVAAVALMLATSLIRSPAPPAAATEPVPVPLPAFPPESVEPVVATLPTPAVAGRVPEPAPAKAEPKEAIPAGPFTVSVLPVENAATEAVVRSAVDTFYRTLLDGLRATPGLVLVTPESTEAAARIPADYHLTMKGTGSLQSNAFTIELKARKAGSYTQPYRIEGRIAAEYQLSGRIPTECGATPGCGDAISMAAQQLKLLRETVFPESPTRSQEMRARLQDPVLGARVRFDALVALESLRGDGAVPTTGRSTTALNALRDPVVVRGAIELAASATEDFVRAGVWKKMRGVGSADLVQPLIAAARADASSNVRAEAVITLAADFAGDPRARAALDLIAHQDSRPVVRVLAQSGLAGKDAWPRHVVASLKDTNLSDLERIEAIYYAVNQDQDRATNLRDVLTDDESIRAFVQLLPKAVRTATTQDKASASQLVMGLVSRLGPIDHPAVTDMLLDAWEHPYTPGVHDTFHVLNQLARRGADPRVRALLEKISAEPADSPEREIARNALNKLAAPPAL
jgi:hypothetical protein